MLRRQPDLPAALLERGRLVLRAGDLEPAERFLHQACRRDPGNHAAQYQLMQGLKRRGKTAEVRAVQQNMDQIERDVIRLRVIATVERERGRVALAGGQFADAEAALRQALEVLPYDYEVHWALHQALQGLGRTAEAKAELARALQLKDRLERIGAIQQRRMTLHPFDPALHGELGELLHRRAARLASPQKTEPR